jgi:hypothetical protein
MPPKKTKVDLAIRKLQFRRRVTKQERQAMLDFSRYFGFAVDRLREHQERYPVRAGAFDDLEGKVRHLRVRGEMWTTPDRWRVVARELRDGSYARFSNGVVSAAKDLVLLDRIAARRGRTA